MIVRIDTVELPAGTVLLRPPRADDAPAVPALARDADVRRWNPRCRIPDEAAAVADCAGRYAGTIALHDIDGLDAHARIGYRVAPWTRGRGVATDPPVAP